MSKASVSFERIRKELMLDDTVIGERTKDNDTIKITI